MITLMIIIIGIIATIMVFSLSWFSLFKNSLKIICCLRYVKYIGSLFLNMLKCVIIPLVIPSLIAAIGQLYLLERRYIFFLILFLSQFFFFLSFLYIVCTCRLDGPVPVRQGWLEGHRLLHGHNCPGCHTWHHTCVLYQVQIYIGRHTPALSYALLVWSPVKYMSTKWGKNIPISLSVYLLNTTYIGWRPVITRVLTKWSIPR